MPNYDEDALSVEPKENAEIADALMTLGAIVRTHAEEIENVFGLKIKGVTIDYSDGVEVVIQI